MAIITDVRADFRGNRELGERDSDPIEARSVTIYERDGWMCARVNERGRIRQELLDLDTAEDTLSEYVERGFVIRDPQHLLDYYGILTEGYPTVSAMDADSAGYPDYPTGRDADVFAEIEVAYYRTIEPEF